MYFLKGGSIFSFVQFCSFSHLSPFNGEIFFFSSTLHLIHSVSHCSAAKELFPGPVANTPTTGENWSQFFPFTVSVCIQIWQLVWWLSQLQLTIQHLYLQTYLNVPHTGRVIQSRVHLAHFLRVFDIPHVQAVVIVYTGKPLVGGVKGQGNRVWILRISHTREKTAAQGENNSLVNLCSLGVRARSSNRRAQILHRALLRRTIHCGIYR